MAMIINTLCNYCLRNDIISSNDLPLLRYCLEKKLYTFLVSVPLFVLGVVLTDFITTISFLWSFYFLRKSTNGFHAKTAIGCFIGSICIEYLLLQFICPFLSLPIVAVLIALSSASIWRLAPFNHPNMNLSPDEVMACRTSSRRHLTILISLIFLFYYIFSAIQIIKGITIGIALDAFLLNIAYFFKWRNLYAKPQRTQSKKHSSHRCERNP